MLPSGSNRCDYWGNGAAVESKQKNLLIRLPGVQTGLVGRLSRLRVPDRLGYKNFKLNIITTQLGPNADMTHKGSQVL